MAAGSWVIPDKAKLNMVNATDTLAQSSLKMALVSSSWTPNNATNEVWGDASSNEIANGNGYTTGGAALANIALTESSGTVKFTCDPVVWTASGGNIPAWRRAVIYVDATVNGKVKPIVAHCLGDSAPADIAATTDGNTLTITPHANGILTVS